MKKQILIFCALAFLLALPLVFAADYVVESGQPFNFTENVYYDNSSKATSAVSCTFTLKDPSFDVLIEDQSMNFNAGGYFSYWVEGANTTGNYGEYTGCIVCGDGNDFGNSCVTIKVTPSGADDINEGQGNMISLTIFLIILIAIFCFIMSYRTNNIIYKIIFVISSLTFILIALLFNIVILYQTLSNYSPIIQGYSAFMLVIRIMSGIGLLALSIYGLLVVFKLYKIKRGLVDM